MEIIYGKNPVMSFLNNDMIKEIYLTDNFADKNFIGTIKKSNIKYSFQKKSFLDKLAATDKHQGIIAIIKDFNYTEYSDLIKYSKTKENPFILVLDKIEDPHNFGAIIRTCEALGVDGIIISKHHSCPLNATVAKVSTGAIANLRICQVTNINQTLQDLKKQGYWIYAAEANQGQSYQNLKFDGAKVLVVGSEGYGISPLVIKQADFRIFIPMKGKVNSLNVSVATAILIAKMIQN